MHARLEQRDAGAMIAGRYRVVRSLAQGGMGEVLEALDVHAGVRVAVKVLRHDIVADREAIARFRREGEILASLRHPNIVSVPFAGTQPDGSLYLVMEMLDGETLGVRMRRERQIQPAGLVATVNETADALTAAHAAGVIHRDLKPDNIFLSQSIDGAEHVKLLDFGVSKLAAEEERLTRTGELLGTPRYMAPEQVSGERDLDARVDVYSLGVILYEAIAGRPPFLGSTTGDLVISILSGKPAPLRTLAPLIDPAVEAVILRAISKSRDARYPSATALAEAFSQATGVVVRSSIAGEPLSVRPGMGTLMMGGGEAPPSMATRIDNMFEAYSEADALRPGTLSAFSAVAPIETPSLPQLDAIGTSPSPDYGNASGASDRDPMPATRATPMGGYKGPHLVQSTPAVPAAASMRPTGNDRPLDRTGNDRPLDRTGNDRPLDRTGGDRPSMPTRDAAAARVQAMPAFDAAAVMAAAKRPKKKKGRSLLLPAAIVGLLLGALVATALVVVLVLRKPGSSSARPNAAPEDRAATVGQQAPPPLPTMPAPAGSVPAAPGALPTVPTAPVLAPPMPVAPTPSPSLGPQPTPVQPTAPAPVPPPAAQPQPSPTQPRPSPPLGNLPISVEPTKTRRPGGQRGTDLPIRLPGGGRTPAGTRTPGVPILSFP